MMNDGTSVHSRKPSSELLGVIGSAVAIATLMLVIAGWQREDIQALDDKIERFEARLDRNIERLEAKLDREIGRLDARIEGIQHSLTDIRERLAGVETRLTGVETRLTNVEARLGKRTQRGGRRRGSPGPNVVVRPHCGPGISRSPFRSPSRGRGRRGSATPSMVPSPGRRTPWMLPMFMSLGETRNRSWPLPASAASSSSLKSPSISMAVMPGCGWPNRGADTASTRGIPYSTEFAAPCSRHSMNERLGVAMARAGWPSRNSQSRVESPLGMSGELADEGGAVEYDAAHVDARAEGLRGTRMGARRDVAVGIDDSQGAGRRGKARERARRPGTDRFQHLGRVLFGDELRLVFRGEVPAAYPEFLGEAHLGVQRLDGFRRAAHALQVRGFADAQPELEEGAGNGCHLESPVGRASVLARLPGRGDLGLGRNSSGRPR